MFLLSYLKIEINAIGLACLLFELRARTSANLLYTLFIVLNGFHLVSLPVSLHAYSPRCSTNL